MKKTDLSTINLNMSDEDKKNQLIFYAAGSFAEANMEEFREMGIVPVCFADKDEAKRNTLFCGYEILPLSLAIERYPNALVVLTCGQQNLTSIVEELSQTVDCRRLRYPYETYYGLGCDFLGKMIIFQYHGGIGYCVRGKSVPDISFSNSLDILFSAVPKYTEPIIQKIIAGEENACTGCKELRKEFWEVKPNINALWLSSAFKGAVCNYNCPECSHILMFRNKEKYDKINGNRLVASEVLQYLCDNHVKLDIGMDKVGFYFLMPIAETALLPDFENLLKIIDKSNGWIIPVFATNGSIYSELWVETANKNPKGFLLCDISAGTVETYKKLKGVTCLDKVVDNLEKYIKVALNPAQVRIKYIFFEGINDNYDDVNGFLDIAKRLRCKVVFSNNLNKNQKITDKIGELYTHMIVELERNHIIYENDVCQRTAFEEVVI